MRSRFAMLALTTLIVACWVAPAAGSPPADGDAPEAGTMTIDRVPLDPEQPTVTVDAVTHCVYLMNKEASPGDRAVRVDLEHGVTYRIEVEGSAFMSTHEGSAADPFPGVVLFYGTDEEDGYATRYTVVAPGGSLTFRTPWLIDPADDVFLLAFFLDHWPESDNRGHYTLRITDTGAPRRAFPEPGLFPDRETLRRFSEDAADAR